MLRIARTITLALPVLTGVGCLDTTTSIGPSRLAFEIVGLPTGSAAAIQVTGPESFNETVTAPRTFDNVEPGTYVVTVTPVTVGSTVYTATPVQQDLVVRPGITVTLRVTYVALGLDLQLVVQGLTNPTFLTAPAGDSRLFIVEQPGRIRVFKGGQLLGVPFLDITSRVSYGGERGLLSLAFDPAYATNGRFYVYFTDTQGNIAVERYTATPSADVANTAATPVINIPHPTYSNHNGGLVMFGPDGMLYMGTGDGGSAGDPPGNAQNTNSLLGKLLRLDVTTLPYTPQGTIREIWAYGLRNPWRFDFRVLPGTPPGADLYIADVGQGNWEEIDVSFGNPGGLNYGWNRMEGDSCYPNGSTGCTTAGLVRPKLVYDHTDGSCSITGGFVYRGTDIPEIRDDYLFSDYCSGFLSSLRGTEATGFTRTRWTIPSIGHVLSFGEDAAGEQYMLTETGRVYKIVPKR